MDEEKRNDDFFSNENSGENKSFDSTNDDSSKKPMESKNDTKKVTKKKAHKSHSSHHHTSKKSDTIKLTEPEFVKTIKKNPWIAATIILAVILAYFYVYGIPGGQGTNTGTTYGDAQISESEATQIVLDFATSQGLTATPINTSMVNDLYQVYVTIQGQDVPIYITKDGENLVPSVIPFDQIPSAPTDSGANTGATPTPTNVPQSEKPQVELFVMSHCPYGTQMEKGILPVVKELDDKIDFEVKFVYYAMHPTAGEVEEQLNQYCIQEEQNDKYLPYLSCFLEAGDGESCLDEVGIDKTALETCTTRVDEEYDVLANLEDTSSWVSGRFPQFNIHQAENQEYGVQGSPTLVINGEQVSSARDAQSLLNTVCSSFTDKPEECDADLSGFGSPGPGFGFDTQGGSATAAGCAF